MGMYTELIIGASLKADTPEEVINIIKYLVGDLEVEPEANPFKGRNVLRGGSFYFAVNTSLSKFWYDGIKDEWTLCSRANIKNYESEIETFIEWLRPHVSQGSGAREMFAISIYEESESPTIYYLN